MITCCFPRSIFAAFLLVSVFSCEGQTIISPTIWATVRTGTFFNSDYNETNSGYCLVKYDTGTAVGKTYYEFDFAGQNPNTNNTLDFECTTAPSSARQHLNVWALNQPYPGINSNIVYATAQANDTNSNNMLTDPTNVFTATRLLDQLSVNSAGVVQKLTLPAPWGQFLFNGKIVLAFTGTNDPLVTSANGFRMKTNTATLSFQTLVGAPPSIGPITNIVVVANQTSNPQAITISDPEDGPDALFPIATSSNEAIVPSGLVSVTGSGLNRTLTVTAGATPGVARIDLSVTDSAGNYAVRTFYVTVIAENFAPVILNLSSTNTLVNTPVSIPFTVADAESPGSTLIASAEIKAYSVGILQSANVTSDPSGTNRTLEITPVTGADGVGIVTVTLSDTNGNSTNAVIYVMVRRGADVAFIEHFDYTPGNSKLFDVSGGLWGRRSATAGSVNLFVSSGQQAYIRPKSSADDGAARLAGAPYAVSSGAVLYTRCTATWTNAAGDGVITNSNGSFMQLLNNSNATSAAVSEVATSTNDVPDGEFRLALIDATATLNPFAELNLSMPPADSVSPTYTIVTRYEVDTGRSTLWVNAASEAVTGVTSTDLGTPQNINYVGIRQDQGMGYIFLDDLKVTVVYKPKLTSVSPPAGGTIDLFFTAGPSDSASAFAIDAASNLTGPYIAATATITSVGTGQFKATVSADATSGFYKVRRLPIAF